jgi:uncharacterized membrane protein
MTSDNRPASGEADTPVFQAVLTPHRSLGRRGFATLMVCAGLFSAIVSLPFFLMGAWPVVGFFGLDVLLLYLAFRASYRSARASEQVVLTHLELMVRKISHWGQAREWRFNPLWVRLHREVDEDYGLQRLAVVHRGTMLDVGGFLPPSERASFADAFAKALAEAKRGPTVN